MSVGEAAIGIDIGGTKIAGGVVAEEGTILHRGRRDSPAKDAHQLQAAIGDLVEELRAACATDWVGISAAGFIDRDRATVRFSPNLAWRDEPLREHLCTRLGQDVVVVVENDANSAAWGEFTFGAGVDVDDLLMVTVGTGIGGGIVLEGELLRGGFGFAGEVGHIRMVPDGELCGCGNRGCLEAYASGSALVRRTRSHVELQPEVAAGLLGRAGGDPMNIDGPMITEAAKAGDEFARSQLAELGQWLGEGVASLAAVLDPKVVVVGGGVCEAGDLLLEPARVAYAQQVTGRGHRDLLEFRIAQLGNDAGIIGAADLARR